VVIEVRLVFPHNSLFKCATADEESAQLVVRMCRLSLLSETAHKMIKDSDKRIKL
jgi:hypothetical protein